MKRRNNHMRSREKETEPALKENESSLLNRKCDELALMLERSNEYIIELEGKVLQLEEELRGAGRCKEPKERSSNLARLRKQIA
jgi:HAMP domain-containing protein